LKAVIGDRLHVAAAGVVAATVFCSSLVFGGGGVWVRFGVEAAQTLAVLLWTFGGCRRPAVALAAVAISVLPLIQVIDLPPGLLARIAPFSNATWKVADVSDGQTRSCMSVEPGSTVQASGRLLLLALTFAALADAVRISAARRLLAGSMAATGLMLLILGMIFGDAGKDRKLLGLIELKGPIWDHVNPTYQPVQSSGFGRVEWIDVCDWHYILDSPTVGGGFGPLLYANMFPAALILMLPFVAACFIAAAQTLRPRWIAYCVGCVPWLVGIPLTAMGVRARAAAVVMVFSFFVWVSMSAPTNLARRVAGWAAVIAGVLILAIVLMLTLAVDHRGLVDYLPANVQAFGATLLKDTRSEPMAIAARIVRAAPLTGTGVNTYRVLYPRMLSNNAVVYFAHNEFFQITAETGLVGSLASLSLLLIVARSAFRFTRTDARSRASIQIAAWTSVLGVIGIALFEWVWHLPALACATCVSFALALGFAGRSATSSSRPLIWRPRIVGLVAAVACLVALRTLYADATAEFTRQSLQRVVADDIRVLRKLAKEGPGPELDIRIEAAEAAAKRAPSNARLEVLLAQAYLHSARLAASDSDRSGALEKSKRWASQARRSSPLLQGLPEPKP
jgi:hypothetical protein